MKAIKKIIQYLVYGLVVVGASVYLFLSLPEQWQEIQTMQGNINDLTIQVDQLSKAMTVLNSVDQKQLSVDVSHVNAALPSGKKTSGFVKGIAAIASASGAVVSQISFSPGLIATDSGINDYLVPNSKAHSVPANLTLSASLNNVVNLVKNITAASQLIGVKSVSFDPTVNGQANAVIGLDVYYEPENDASINWSTVRAITDKEREVLKKLSNRDVFILPEEQR